MLGPYGLLQALECHLGLAGPPITESLRIARYLAAINAVDCGVLFFSRSKEVDAWATARTLLSLRDELISAGWRGEDCGVDSPRLRTFSEIELSLHNDLPPGFSDRLMAVLEALRLQPILPYSGITLVTPLIQLPKIWQEILHLLNDSGVRLHEAALAACGRAPDLQALQLACLDGLKPSFCGDQSVIVLESDDEAQAAEVLSAYLKAVYDEASGIVIIRDEGSAFLDSACKRVGIPQVGGRRNSRWRGALQVLPLAVEVAWSPFNPLRLMEFLSLPAGPVPRQIARLFINALRDEPGTGGALWNQAWQEARSVWKAFLARDTPESDVEKIVARDVTEWHKWLSPSRFDQSLGMPRDEAIAICQRIQKWASKHLPPSDDRLYSAARRHAASVAAAIEASGLKQITKIQFERIIDDAVDQAFCISVDTAEAAPWSSVDKAGQLWAPCKSAIWWNFVERSRAPEPSFWSTEERAVLQQTGTPLEPLGAEQLRQSHSWLSPLLNCTERLILVRPRTIAGQPASAHPLWHEIGYWIDKSDPSIRPGLFAAAEDFLTGALSSFADSVLDLKQVATRLPPAPRRLWHVPPELLVPRAEESFTSMQALIGCQFAWTLTYQVRIRQSAILEVMDMERAAGNVAHLIVQRLFDENKDWTCAAAIERSYLLFDELVPTMAAPMLLPGRALDLKRSRQRIATAVGTLVKILNDAQLVVVDCEIEKRRQFEAKEFTGKIDLLCQTGSNELIVLDLKWTRWPMYKRKEIAGGRHLQLACYSWLLSQEAGSFPEAGYFLLRNAQLVCTNKNVFPPDTQVSSANLQKVWEAAFEAYAFHTARIHAGSIVATGVGEPSEHELQLLEEHRTSMLQLEPPCRICAYGNLCGQKEPQ